MQPLHTKIMQPINKMQPLHTKKITQPREWVRKITQPLHPKTSGNLSSQKLTQPLKSKNHATYKKIRQLWQQNHATSTKNSGNLTTKKIRHPSQWPQPLHKKTSRHLSTQKSCKLSSKKIVQPQKNMQPLKKKSRNLSTQKIANLKKISLPHEAPPIGKLHPLVKWL